MNRERVAIVIAGVLCTYFILFLLDSDWISQREYIKLACHFSSLTIVLATTILFMYGNRLTKDRGNLNY